MAVSMVAWKAAKTADWEMRKAASMVELEDCRRVVQKVAKRADWLVDTSGNATHNAGRTW